MAEPSDTTRQDAMEKRAKALRMLASNLFNLMQVGEQLDFHFRLNKVLIPGRNEYGRLTIIKPAISLEMRDN